MSCACNARSPQRKEPTTMNAQRILMSVLWLAVLGLVIVVGSRVATKAASRAAV